MHCHFLGRFRQRFSVVVRRAKSAWGVSVVKVSGSTGCERSAHSAPRIAGLNLMPKPKRPKQAKPAVADMSTGEATAATLISHGFETVYALPGVHNDHLFDAFQRSGAPFRVVHSRHEQGAAYLALRAALAPAKPQAYVVVPGPGLLN